MIVKLWIVSLSPGLFQHGGLGAQQETVPALKSIDGFVRVDPHVSALEVERFRAGPLHPHNGVE